jgi:glycosyltransferase involved in cell wall biosynthesis
VKVLHLVKTTRGARWALLQMRHLIHLGVDCHVVLPDEGGLAPHYAAAGATVHVLDLNAAPLTRGFFACAGAFARLVSEISPDVVHSHFVATTLLMRYAMRGMSCARVFQVPGPLHLENAALARLDVASGGRNDHWIGSCEWTCRRYAELGVAADRVFLSHYGSDLDGFKAAAPGTLRAELGLGDRTRLVGMVAYCYRPKTYLGSRRGIKGHEDFIDAVGILRRDGLDVVGVIAGGAWTGGDRYYAAVQQYARSNTQSRVVFLGTRHDVASIYADLEVAAHPSLSENLGGAAESLLLGVPTVTTNIGGFPDLIRDGVTGWMVPPRSPVSLAAAMRDLLEHPARAATMAAAGQRHARQLLDVGRTARQISQIYARITDSRAAVADPAGVAACGAELT